jgi:AsmA protein
MPVWLRRALIGLAGLLIVLAAAAAWFVASFDANKYKGVAIDWMKTNRNRTLVIAGPVELSVFPRLAVKLSKLTLSEVARPDTFAALDEAALAVDLLPLLRGEVVVGKVSAQGVRLTYLRDAKGRSNVDDLAKPGPEQPGEKKALRFDVGGIALRDVRVRVKDTVSGTDGELWLKSLDAGRLADKLESPLALDAQFDFRQPALRGHLNGDTLLKLDLVTTSAALRKTRLAFKGDAPGATGIDALIEGALAWDGAAKSASAEDLSLKLSGHTGALKHDGTTLAVERFAYDPSAKSLALRKLQARLKATQAGQPLALELDWPELSVAGDKLAGSAFSGKLTRGGEMPLAATFKSSAPAGNFDALRLPGFEAQLSSHGAARKLDGTLRADLTLRPGQAALAFDKLELQAKVQEPSLAPLALAMRGTAVASAQRSSWNLAGQLNQNNFASEGSATLGGSTPHIVAKARFDALDLNRLLGPAAAASAPATGRGGASDTPVDLAGLRSVNGQVSLRAGSFAWRQYRIADAAIEATMDNGMLRINTLQGRAWGGQLAATAFADARASRVAIKGTAQGVDVNALVKDVAAKDWIAGTGRVGWDLDTAGRTVNEMKSRMKGTASLQVRDGALKGINLAKSLRQAKAALSMKQDTAQKAQQTEKTDFSELSASFQMADGVARSRDLDMKSPFLRLGGEGAIDVGRGRIDYLARATVTGTSKGQDGAELEALKGLTVPVRLAGPFEAMDWKIEWSAVAGGLLQKKLEDKLGEKLGLKPAAPGASQPKSADKLKETLKGLFGK